MQLTFFIFRTNTPMNRTPYSPLELQALNSSHYRTLHTLFERLSHTKPDLNQTILSLLDDLQPSQQAQFMNILYKLELERNSLTS